ncbi:site-specific DNA-methyltransferase [Pelagibacterium xiamenense]|uniref:site-specific DNA-methyltransferase n=1 Tax=Pelagibacterium xiamenense TaxID=2901140 RepID=UPI001E5F3A07|nr:site-specific DNA-methyltransferase [Pelagibacterium xiamenense]MCD7059115.1 site-specific DNA-methyltransferase [Pelagibacterium xiamenense]
MPNVEKQRERLVSLLKELFQLDQPDLDFGFYRIMHAKAGQVTKFLEEDLLGIIRDAFGEADGARVEQAKAAYAAARKQAEEFGAPDPDAAPKVKEAKAALDAAKDSGSNEGDVYDHLYRFFERYYDSGDFMSRRYFARETDGKAAPYAVPYDGREVYLHWANRDQYYIKTSEYLTNFTFDPTQAKEFQAHHGALVEQKPLKVHCRIVSASEGEHNNVKASEQTERYFIIHEPEPVKIETGDTGEPELVIQFQYRPDPEKVGQEGTWRKSRLAEAAQKVKAQLPTLEGAGDYVTALMTPAPTEAEKDRTLLEKYLAQYTGRNTMDYFIHKDLGGFLRRELDFYIKNEVMRLDDIESSDAPRVESYLAKVKVLRRIAQHLIDFVAQLEDFQKRLWLKKKFVVDTQYCITLDRIPEEFYVDIAASEAQREQWIELFGIEEFQGYSSPLSEEFLRHNDRLPVDTGLFSTDFRDRLISEIDDVDGVTNGLLLHGDNFHGMRLLTKKYAESVKLAYLDPPYNTNVSAIPYKNNYRHSSWASMMQDRLGEIKKALQPASAVYVSIDKNERNSLEGAMDSVFGKENKIEELIWSQNTNDGRSPRFSTNHEYVEVYSKSRPAAEADVRMFREPKPGFSDVMDLIKSIEPEYPSISEIQNALSDLYAKRKAEYKAQILAEGLDWETEKRNDEWKGLYPYRFAEYRDASGRYVEESRARDAEASIWVFRESDWTIMESDQKQSATTKDPEHPNYRYYEVHHPVTGKPCAMPSRGWKGTKFRDPDYPDRNSLESLMADHRIAFGEDENKVPQQKRFLHEVETNVAKSIFVDYSDGEKETSQLFGRTGVFLAPKHTGFVSRFIRQVAEKEDIVIDIFGGSGSTGGAVIQSNREDGGVRKYILMEANTYLDNIIIPRIKKTAFASKWQGGKPKSKDSLSQIVKYMRVESYEDALNNLALRPNGSLASVTSDFSRDYMLRYWLDFETKGSPSLLNIEDFSDPTSYTLKVKQAGTDASVDRTVDLVETFNWLIGLHVEHLDRWRGYDAAFKREVDPELPDDANTRLMLDGALKETDDGAWRFRKVEGYTLRTPGDHNDREKVLVVWRKLTGDLEQDNLMLDEWFRKYRLSAQDTEFDVIYVNGSNNLPSLLQADETWKVRLIEEAFHQAMWDVEG